MGVDGVGQTELDGGEVGAAGANFKNFLGDEVRPCLNFYTKRSIFPSLLGGGGARAPVIDVISIGHFPPAVRARTGQW